MNRRSVSVPAVSLAGASPGLRPPRDRSVAGSPPGSTASVPVGGRRSGDRTADAASRPSAAPERLRAEQRFLDWLADPVEPDAVHVTGEAATMPLHTLLGLACTSDRPLPSEAAATLGMSTGATVGAAAAELVLAVQDPSGPRCRSYRSAVYYLRDLHALTAAFEEL
jgi:hypothetical protein